MNALDFSSTITRDKVNAFEAMLKQAPQVELKVEHIFSEGVYTRKLYIPKGVILTGKIHKYSQLNILFEGDMSVLVGDHMKRITAPFMIVSPPGTKRVAQAHEDSIWLTIHGTHETDVDRIERHFIAQSEQDYLAFCGQQNAQLTFEGFDTCLG